ncbi:hypothetical protein [Pyrococcus yayanosii]|uniref:Uncharacterized protein n=1 Tax=Pyrococcus yayanosii (strain CH1 / JCM 16557) TaxID=529709 RepID=F8AFQ3_PYRYC|nr:hypothetical protein [Pyrococcus yayanosii]AEH25029.1 hypothetical protein PYCH_13590 [Pyrococcus yayanosii CH1]
MKIRLKATILFQTLLLLIFAIPYLIKSGISRHILFPATLVTGIILASKSREAFKEYLHEQVRQERDTNFVAMYNVLILSLVILVLLSISLAWIVGKNGYSKNIVGFMVLLLLYVFLAFYSPISFSRIVTIAVSLYTPNVLALELAGFYEMPIILIVSAIFRVLLWVLGIKLALRIFKLKENGIDPVLSLFPLMYTGWIITIIRLVDYLYFPIYLRRGIEGFLIIGAWGLSFYLLGRKLRPYIGIIAYLASFSIGVVLFILLPPPISV